MKNLKYLPLVLIALSCSSNNEDDELDVIQSSTVTIEENLNNEYSIYAIVLDEKVDYDNDMDSHIDIKETEIRDTQAETIIDRCPSYRVNLSTTSYHIKRSEFCTNDEPLFDEQGTLSLNDNILTFSGGFEVFKNIMPDIINITSDITVEKSINYGLLLTFEYDFDKSYSPFGDIPGATPDKNKAHIVLKPVEGNFGATSYFQVLEAFGITNSDVIDTN